MRSLEGVWALRCIRVRGGHTEVRVLSSLLFTPVFFLDVGSNKHTNIYTSWRWAPHVLCWANDAFAMISLTYLFMENLEMPYFVLIYFQQFLYVSRCTKLDWSSLLIKVYESRKMWQFCRWEKWKETVESVHMQDRLSKKRFSYGQCYEIDMFSATTYLADPKSQPLNEYERNKFQKTLTTNCILKFWCATYRTETHSQNVNRYDTNANVVLCWTTPLSH